MLEARGAQILNAKAQRSKGARGLRNLRVRLLDFSSLGALSLTPCFSGVLRANRSNVNRFNGFVCSPWFRHARGRKPLKLFTLPRRSPNTPLKQGVNERRAAAGKT